jgi:hypothetical protein
MARRVCFNCTLDNRQVSFPGKSKPVAERDRCDGCLARHKQRFAAYPVFIKRPLVLDAFLLRAGLYPADPESPQ